MSPEPSLVSQVDIRDQALKPLPSASQGAHKQEVRVGSRFGNSNSGTLTWDAFDSAGVQHILTLCPTPAPLLFIIAILAICGMFVVVVWVSISLVSNDVKREIL